MANRLNDNPMVVDETGTTIPGPLSIKALVWTSTSVTGNDIAADDDLIIHKAGPDGPIIFAKRAETSVDGLVLPFGGAPWKANEGLHIAAIDGGELHIFLE